MGGVGGAVPFTRRLHTSKSMLEPKPRVPLRVLCSDRRTSSVQQAKTVPGCAHGYSLINACEVRIPFTICYHIIPYNSRLYHIHTYCCVLVIAVRCPLIFMRPPVCPTGVRQSKVQRLLAFCILFCSCYLRCCDLCIVYKRNNKHNNLLGICVCCLLEVRRLLVLNL